MAGVGRRVVHDFETDSVRIVERSCVVPGRVVVAAWWTVDQIAQCDEVLGDGLHVLARLGVEGEMVDAGVIANVAFRLRCSSRWSNLDLEVGAVVTDDAP